MGKSPVAYRSRGLTGIATVLLVFADMIADFRQLLRCLTLCLLIPKLLEWSISILAMATIT